MAQLHWFDFFPPAQAERETLGTNYKLSIPGRLAHIILAVRRHGVLDLGTGRQFPPREIRRARIDAMAVS